LPKATARQEGVAVRRCLKPVFAKDLLRNNVYSSAHIPVHAEPAEALLYRPPFDKLRANGRIDL